MVRKDRQSHVSGMESQEVRNRGSVGLLRAFSSMGQIESNSNCAIGAMTRDGFEKQCACQIRGLVRRA